MYFSLLALVDFCLANGLPVDRRWNKWENLSTMRITSLSIKNFRCFESLTLDLKVGLNILVGENSAGKSSVFLAISKLLQCTQQDSSQVFTTADLRYGKLERQGLVVQCNLVLDPQEQKQLLDSLLPQPLPLTEKAEVYELLAPVLQIAEVTCTWQETRRDTYIKLGPMFVLRQWVSDAVRSGGSTSDLGDLIRDLRSKTDTLEDILRKKELWKSKDALHRVGEVLLSRFKAFAEFRARPSTSARSTALESLEGGETASVLLNLKNHAEPRQRRRYRRICSEFSSFLPSLRIEAVEREPSSGLADVQFMEERKDWPIPLDNVGAGVTELLTFLTNLVARDGYIFVIEEPELHLHPQAKRRLNELIRESAKMNQIFLMTHDQYFVDPDNLRALIRLSITDRGTQAAFLPDNLSPKALGQLSTAMKDPTKREVVFARAVLLVEDESQQNFVLGCAGKLRYNLNRSGASVISFDGKDGYKPYVALLKALNIPYLCLRDLNWGPPKSKSPEVYRALGCELEKFLEKAGLGQLMEKAKHEVGSSKPRVAKYVGEHITPKQIPSFFHELLGDLVKLCEKSANYE